MKTTGKRGNGARRRASLSAATASRPRSNDLQTRLNKARSALDARLAALKKANAAALGTLETQDNQATTDQEAALRAAATDPQQVNGLLLRKNALTHPIRREAGDAGQGRDRPVHRLVRLVL